MLPLWSNAKYLNSIKPSTIIRKWEMDGYKLFLMPVSLLMSILNFIKIVYHGYMNISLKPLPSSLTVSCETRFPIWFYPNGTSAQTCNSCCETVVCVSSKGIKTRELETTSKESPIQWVRGEGDSNVNLSNRNSPGTNRPNPLWSLALRTTTSPP